MISKGMRINNRYEIIQSIGEGGMANVYLASDIILGREVAIKILRTDLSGDEKFIRRFKREALAASSLSHPNIVSMYDVGEDDGKYFIVMEYIKGKTLKQLIRKRGSLVVSEAIDIMLQITDGMKVAHDAYIIHRDLKPQNIMIDLNGQIKITDFGIAMAQNSSSLTQTNSVMGSVHYLPPEQASGAKATIKSDIYSLGILFFELLTGTLPFRGENAVEIALKHMKEPMPSIRKINNKIPQSIENIIYKATAKNPKNRYTDIREMHSDLKNALNQESEKKIVFEYPETDFEEVKKIISPVKIKKENNEEIEVTEVKTKVEKKQGILMYSLYFVILFLVLLALFIIIPPLFKKTDSIKIPDVTGMSVSEAQEILQSKGLKLSEKIETQTSSTIPKGHVIKTDPLPERYVKKGRKVIIWESLGEEEIVLEDYNSKSIDEVKEILEKTYNFKVVIVKKKLSDYKDLTSNTIIDQKPASGTKMKKGDQVTFYVPDMLDTYPDFVKEKWKVSDIEAFCDKYGVNLKKVYEDTTSHENGEIIRQSRGIESKIVKGADLTITIARKYSEPGKPKDE